MFREKISYVIALVVFTLIILFISAMISSVIMLPVMIFGVLSGYQPSKDNLFIAYEILTGIGFVILGVMIGIGFLRSRRSE